MGACTTTIRISALPFDLSSVKTYQQTAHWAGNRISSTVCDLTTIPEWFKNFRMARKVQVYVGQTEKS